LSVVGEYDPKKRKAVRKLVPYFVRLNAAEVINMLAIIVQEN